MYLLTEIIFRIRKKYSKIELNTKETKQSYKVEEFKSLVFDEKKKLVILDNKVLDLADYEWLHPGGKFVFKKNIGRDISKYFYGSYKLVNDSNYK